MKTIRRFAIASVALALGVPAFAQSADRAATAPTGTYTPTTVTHTLQNTGSAKAVLYTSFNRYITHTGSGAGGADVSAIEPGLTIYGFGQQASLNYRIGDDFVVTGTWDLDNITWGAYQTSAPTAGTITSMDLNVSGDGGGQPGALIENNNVISTNVWSGVYRTTSTGLTATNRAIIKVTSGPLGAATSALGAGTYWVDGSCGGTLGSGPWAPVPITQSGDNAVQNLAGAGWNPIGGAPGVPHDMDYEINGTSQGGGGAPSYCTAVTPGGPCSGITPALAGPAATGGTYVITAAPVPSVSNAVGLILCHSTQIHGGPPNAPTLGAIGWLCVAPFARTGVADTPSAGTGCDSQYDWDMTAWNAANLTATGSAWFQGWYRNSQAGAGQSRFTDAIGPVNVP